MRKTLHILLFLLGTGLLLAQSDDKVFYSSFRPEGWDIHLSKDNGKSFTPFTRHESLDYDAKISPDGQWVVFTSEEFGINDEQPLVQTYIFSPQLYGEITAIRLEDGRKVRLTHNKWEDGAPLWINGN